MQRSLCALVCALVLAASGCASPHPTSEEQFQQWLAADANRAPAFRRFEAMLQEQGVSGVVANYQLWRVDQVRPQCATAPFLAPPEEMWAHIVPALRFIRDHVKPTVGELDVQSGYRDAAFNACVRGAPASAHQAFYALDLTPTDPAVSRETLIERLCPIHAAAGADVGVGLGIYAETRFHVDARGFRGWGVDFHRTTFPCDLVSLE